MDEQLDYRKNMERKYKLQRFYTTSHYGNCPMRLLNKVCRRFRGGCICENKLMERPRLWKTKDNELIFTSEPYCASSEYSKLDQLASEAWDDWGIQMEWQPGIWNDGTVTLIFRKGQGYLKELG